MSRRVSRLDTLRYALAITGMLTLAADARAQGVANAGVSGTVRDESGALLDQGLIRVLDRETGFVVRASTRNGRFLVQGLEPGRSYTIVAASLGFAPQRVEHVSPGLGELLEVEFRLQRTATQLDTVRVAAADRGAPHAHGGTATSIVETQLERLPTLNRDLFDFVRLVPQVSMKNGLSAAAFSAGGVGFRFNNFLINGASERTLAGSVSSAFAGARSVPLDAVQEYQILVAPYDVRYGDFAGALVNTVTKSGTNALRGTVFANGRNDRLARASGSSAETPYDRSQFGFAVGGPLIRDKVHFFLAPEVQRLTFPAPGPYAGQPPGAPRPVPVSEADLARLEQIMSHRYGLIAGSAAPVENRSNLNNAFARVDLSLPTWNSRVVAWHNYAAGEEVSFSRAAVESFSLTSHQFRRAAMTRTTAVQLHTAVARAGGAHNELLISRRADGLDPLGVVQQPLVRVQLPSVAGGQAIVNTGTPEVAHGGRQRLSSTSVKDNFSLPAGERHLLTFGAELEAFTIRRGPAPGSFGIWTFANLDNLEQGAAERYQVPLNLGNALAPLRGVQYAAYVTDQWHATGTLSFTGGLRVDLLALADRPPYHPLVDSAFGRRTDEMPVRVPEFSPRLGFVWNPSGDRSGTLRGGVGVFATRYPLAWAHSALLADGVSGGLLTCGLQRLDRGPAPAFNPDHRSPPRECAGGQGIGTLHGDVNMLARDLRLMRTIRGSLAWDRRLPAGVLFTGEALATRALSDFIYVNLNHPDPLATDPSGRVMYGAILPTGVPDRGARTPFTEVIELRNTSRNHGVQLAGRLERPLTQRGAGSVSYTWSRVRDVQTPLRVATRGTVAWSSAWVYSGRQEELRTGVSGNDIPHRVILTGTYAFPHPRWRTELSLYYVGESGRPFTYLAWGAAGRGDLNADGALNDPIYVPLNATDTNEIRFSGIAGTGDNSLEAQAQRVLLQREAFEEFVAGTPCLRRQRGRILARNSCREPWSNTTMMSVRQYLPVGGRTFEAQLDIFNVLNLLNERWGLYQQANPAVLEHFRQTPAPPEVSAPIFRFDPGAAGWITVPAESAFQLQFAVRYRF